MHELVSRLDAKPELRLVPYAFERAYGRPPASVWSAPYAVRLADQDLAVAVQWQVVVAAAPRRDGLTRVASLDHAAEWSGALTGEHEPPPAWARVPCAALLEARPATGVDLLIHTDLPDGSGLPCDAPLRCAVVAAATGRTDLAGGVDDVETAAALCGTPGYAVGRSGARLPFDPASAGLRMLLVITPGPETAAAIDAALAAGAAGAWPQGSAVVAIMPGEARRAVRAAVTRALAGRGPRPPRFLNLVPAGPVRRHG